ncbi:polysaccharide pyruvyl transferase family protein [Emcibacter sp.]|uniref:polysaccharide pyruvyl transferase family protein n=1 Tax=Emcibacter sp. TaxID=1979954 RepID=UPI003A8D7984
MAKQKLKALHLASFNGNIGDNANHIGFRNSMKLHTDFDIEYTNLEIREFYWGHRKFDQSFVDLANKHDFLIVGGGNYFELWVEGSATGTSIDIEPGLFKNINVPVLINALGVDPGQGVPEANLQKFRGFLDILLGSDQYLVSVRNDGAMDTLREYLPPSYGDAIHQIPDGGFFTTVPDIQHYEIPKAKRVISINLAGDMLETRFATGKHISYDDFLRGMAGTLEKVLEKNPDVNLVFIPHIFRDITTISQCLEYFTDHYRRRRIQMAPYLLGDPGQDYIFSLYAQSALVLGMRFHSNVCSIGLNTPTIGLVNYRQIEKLYQELDLMERTVEVNKEGFEDKLLALIESSLATPQPIKQTYAKVRKTLEGQLEKFHNYVNDWLKTNIE